MTALALTELAVAAKQVVTRSDRYLRACSLAPDESNEFTKEYRVAHVVGDYHLLTLK